MSVDPFPNELVEAAAKALRTSEIPITLSPTEGWVFDADESARAVLAAVLPLIEQRARLDERERLSSRVHENGWCPTCARDTDEAAMQRLAGKPVESLSRTDLIGLALRNLSAAMDAEARAAEAEQRVIDRLAREAGSNPYTTYAAQKFKNCHTAWDHGAACGVAAERARADTLLAQVRAIMAEPLDERADHGPTRAGQYLRIDALLSAALAPERTTATEPEGEK